MKYALPIVFLALVATAQGLGWQDELAAHEEYCSNVSIWEANKADGYRAEERSGHPNFEGIDCETF